MLEAGRAAYGMFRSIQLALFCLSLAAQLLAEQPFIRLFTTEDGLVRNWVTAIRRDQSGRLWFATAEGLSAYDGEQFTNYTEADGLPDRFVGDFLDAGHGVCLILTGAGAYRFWPRGASPNHSIKPVFQRVELKSGAKGKAVSGPLFQTKSGEVWVGGDDGLFRVEAIDSKPVLALVSLGSEEKTPLINSIAEDAKGDLWILTFQRLYKRSRDGSTQSWGRDIGLDGEALVGLAFDHRGRLWIGSQNHGIQCVDVSGAKPAVIEHYSTADGKRFPQIEVLFVDEEDNLWVGASPGLWRLSRNNQGQPEWRTFNGMVGALDVLDVQSDGSGAIWLALSNLGAARLFRHGFTTFAEADGLTSRGVLSVFENREGQLYAVTGVDHALHAFDGRQFAPVRPLIPAKAGGLGWGEQAIALEDRRGEWWIARDEGLLRYAKVAHIQDLSRTMPKAFYRPVHGTSGDTVIRLYEDREGGIWVGTSSGVARWNPETESFTDFTAELAHLAGDKPLMYSFAEDDQSRIWIGMTGLVVRFEKGRFTAIREGIPKGLINGLVLDHAGRLWMASSRGGLLRMDEPASASPHVTRYTTAEGLGSNQLYSVVEDRQGRIYVAGGKGVDRLDPATGFLEHFGVSDGLPPGEVQRMYCDRQGAVWFASNFGLSRYEPGHEATATSAKPVIHSVRVGGVAEVVSDEGLAQIGSLDFKGRTDISVSYGSVDFAATQRPKYQYRLLPGDSEWRRPTRTRSAEFAELGPAAYRFEVRTLDGLGHPGKDVAAVVFEIPRPLWQRWWFVLLMAACLAGAADLLYSYRLRQRLAVERVRTQLATDLHDDLGAGLVEIAILTEVARQSSPQRPQAEALEGVAAKARELRSSISDIVWSVDPVRDQLTNVVERWRQIANSALGNISITFSAPEEAETNSISVSFVAKRHLILMFKEAIANVARHAGASHVAVSVRLEQRRLQVSISDDGSGYDVALAEENGGNGLRNMRMRAAEMKGTIDVETGPGAGTIVRFSIPV